MDFAVLRKGKRDRWWVAKTEEQKKLFELAKEDVVCYLSIMRFGVKCDNSYGKFAEYMENPIDFNRMGLRSFGEFLFHCDDCLEIRSDGYEYYLFIKEDGAQETQEVAHIQDLVQNQRKPVTRRSFIPTHENTFPCHSEKLLEIYYDLRIPEPEVELASSQNHNTNSNNNNNNRNGGFFSSSRGGRAGGGYRSSFNQGSGISRFNHHSSGGSSRSFGSSRSSNNNSSSSTNFQAGSSTTSTNTSNINNPNIFIPTLKPLNQSAVEYLKRKNSNNNSNTSTIKTISNNNPTTTKMLMTTQTQVLKPINQVSKIITSTSTTTTTPSNFPLKPSTSSTTTENNDHHNNSKSQDSKRLSSLNLPARVISNINLSLASGVRKGSTTTNNNNNISSSEPPPLRPLMQSHWTDLNTTLEKTTANTNNANNNNNNNAPVNTYSPVISIPRLRTIVPKSKTGTLYTVNNCAPLLKSINPMSRENKEPPSEPVNKVRRISVLGHQPPPALKPLNQLRRDVSVTDSGLISVKISNDDKQKNTISSQSQQQQEQKLQGNPLCSQKISMSDTVMMDADQIDDGQEGGGGKPPQVLNQSTPTTIQSAVDDELSTMMAKECSIVEKKKICRRLVKTQMNLTMPQYTGKIVGGDEYGFIFVQLSDPVVQQSFNYFKAEIQRFYETSEHQNEYRMNLNEIEQGIFVIVFMETSGLFIRSRIDEDCKSTDYCIIFDIDECDYHVVSKKNVYHIHDKFTMRHPQAIMVIQRGTEAHMLNPKLHEIIATAFEHISSVVEVTNITPPHSILHAPVVSIKSGGQDLYEILIAHGLSSLDDGTSSKEKVQILKILEKKSHIVVSD